jgi:hypothetical protein
MMATAIGFAETCSLDAPASRRFYVHVGSFGLLVAAQPSIYDEVARALALSGASRALDQAAQDWMLFKPNAMEVALPKLAEIVHDAAADALRNAFQCIVQLVPPRFGATELLLAGSEQINAWCYEDGYLTYATDENAAAIMYAETGSLRRLRSEIRRTPDFDPALQMISGRSLFLFDQREGTGPGTAKFYQQQSTRLLRGFRRDSLPERFDDGAFARDFEGKYVSSSDETFEGDSVLDMCRSRAKLMVATLLNSLPESQGA